MTRAWRQVPAAVLPPEDPILSVQKPPSQSPISPAASASDSLGRVGLMLGGGVVALALMAVVALQFGAPLGVGPRPVSDDEAAAFARGVMAVFDDVQELWRDSFGAGYKSPNVTFTTGVSVSPCAGGVAATGPFYCPERLEAVFDLTFFGALNARLRRNGDLGTALVVAMVSAASVQDQLGLLREARAEQSPGEAKAADTVLAAQADCLAGVWAAHAQDRLGPVPEGFYDQLIGIARNVMKDHASLAPDMPAQLDPFRAAPRKTREADFQRGYKASDPVVCLPPGRSSLG